LSPDRSVTPRENDGHRMAGQSWASGRGPRFATPRNECPLGGWRLDFSVYYCGDSLALIRVAAREVGVDAEGELGSARPNAAMTEAGSQPRATRIEANVWRSLCGVTPAGRVSVLKEATRQGRRTARRRI
jgi:hypothetical protein